MSHEHTGIERTRSTRSADGDSRPGFVRRTGAAALALQVWVTLGFATALGLLPHLVGHGSGQLTTGTVVGRILDADTLRPVVGVDVGTRELGTTPTDTNGRFQIRGAPSGPITVWVRDDPPYRYTLAPAMTADVAPGQVVSVGDQFVRLHAEVSGHLTDRRGRPIAGAHVAAVAREYSSLGPYRGPSETIAHGHLWPYVAATARTSFDGEFRVRGLRAGRAYFLLAYTARAPEAVFASDAIGGEALATWSATYFPGVPSLASAAPIVLTSREHRSNVQLTLDDATTLCADLLITARGSPAALDYMVEEMAVAELRDHGPGPHQQWPRTGRTGPDGKARICSLYSGRFRVTVWRFESLRRADAEHLYGSQEILLTADGATREFVIHAELQTPVDVVIEGRSDGRTPDAFDDLNLNFSPKLPREQVLRTGPGEFRLQVWPAIRRSFVLGGLPRHAYVESVSYGADELSDSTFLPRRGSGDTVRFVVAADGGTVDGFVRDIRGDAVGGSWVFLLPDTTGTDAALAVRARLTLADARGYYAFAGVRPGPHRLVATTNGPPAVFHGNRPVPDLSPETVAVLRRAGLRSRDRVELPPGGHRTVNLVPAAIR